jgi:hypothetical protein
MTNKTITLSRELVERAVMRPGKESLAVNNADIIARGRAQAQIRELLAEPVPPAGKSLQCWNCKADFTLADRANCDGCCWKCGKEIDLDDYVTRLQADVERLKQAGEVMSGAVTALDKRNAEVDALQSELTKAREFETDALRYRFIRQGSSESDYICLSEISEGMDMAIDEALANQAAPADKGQGEPVAEIVSKFGDPEAFGERELIALKDISKFPYGTKLYAEQPAPVVFVPFKVISLPPSLTDHHAFDVLRDELAKVGVQVREPKP